MRRAMIALVALIAACSDPICGCTPVMDFGWAFVEGEVRSSTADPVPDADVSAVGPLHYSNPTPARTGPDGTFTMTVYSDAGAGDGLVDFLVAVPGSPAETVLDLPVSFRMGGEAPDTVQVVLTLP